MALDIISTAYAASTATQATGGETLPPLLLLGGFLIIFYFMLWRPQSKRAKAHQHLIQQLQKGDEVATSGGLLGRVVRLSDDFIVLAVTSDLEIKVQRSAVSVVLPKGTMKSI